MAYQDWYTAASINAQTPAGALPPALVPSSNSVLDEQSDPGGYTSSNPSIFNATSPSNTPVSSTNQISQIMNSVNPSPLVEGSAQGTTGMGYGSAPMSWNQMSTGGPTGPSTPGTGSTNSGITHNYGEGALYETFGTDSEGIAAANKFNDIITEGRQKNPHYSNTAWLGNVANSIINTTAALNPTVGALKDGMDAVNLPTNFNVEGDTNEFLKPGWSATTLPNGVSLGGLPNETRPSEYGNHLNIESSGGKKAATSALMNQQLGIDSDWWTEVMDAGVVDVTSDADDDIVNSLKGTAGTLQSNTPWGTAVI